jgi:hypothetical protein
VTPTYDAEHRSIWTEMEEKGIEYKSPEYWAYLQDRAGKR